MSESLFENLAFGCIPSKKDLRDYKLPKVAMALQLPESFSVLHSQIKNQVQVCSCVAHSVVEVVEAINKNEARYSTNWIYGYRPFGYLSGKGMCTRQALSTTVNQGCVLYDDFAGNTEMPEIKDFTMRNLDTLIPKANKRKMYTYAKLINKDEIKKAIFLTQNPVIVCVHCCDPFKVDKDYKLVYNSKKFNGYHAMVCYGWNKDGLLIQNSWGENWANKGTCILPEEYPITESWMVTNKESDFSAVKPNAYLIRKIIQSIINFINTLFTKDFE